MLLSPSDLVEAAECRHRSVMSLRVAHGLQPAEPDTGSGAAAAAGRAHEAALVEGFAAEGLSALNLERHRTPTLEAWRLLAQETTDALRNESSDADVVLQGAVVLDLPGRVVLVGRPDFLRRTDSGWRVEDAKLARSVKASALLQTMLYRCALERAGVEVHDDIRLHLGNHKAEDVPARSADAWARRVLDGVITELARAEARGALQQDHVEHVEWCSACGTDTPCGRQRAADRHLSLVADIRRDQVRRLVDAGITTIDALAQAAGPVSGMGQQVFEQLREQAALQLETERTGRIPVRIRQHPTSVKTGAAHPGLWLLPPPDAGDVFFDMEGYPLYSDGSTGNDAFGLEYLLGATHDGDAFTAFWGDDRPEEAAAFTAFVDWVEARRAQHPALHVYHYAPYEKTALARLASRHATRGDVIDGWLRDGVLVDLFHAVRGGLRAGVPSYSIKKIEALYGVKHAGNVQTAGESIEQYRRYLATDDAAAKAQLRKDITDYNEDDCRSTRDLRDYLLALRARALDDGRLAPLVIEAETPGDTDEVSKQATDTEALRAELAAATEALLDGAPIGVPIEGDPVAEARRLLAGMLGQQVREEKAAWQDVFRICEEVQAGSALDAVDDAKVLGGLVPQSGAFLPAQGRKKARYAWTFDAPVQETRVELGGVKACIAGAPVDATVEQLDGEGDVLRVVVAVKVDVADEYGWCEATIPEIDALLKADSYSGAKQQRSLLDLAGVVGGEEVLSPTAPRRAGRALLVGRPSVGDEVLPPTTAGADSVQRARELVAGADGLVLAVQGPPGAGKSYLGAEVVHTLLAAGEAAGQKLTIGVTANSHAVITHLLGSIHERTPSARVRHFRNGASGAKDPSKWTQLCQHDACPETAYVTTNEDGWLQGHVLGGTSYAWSAPGAPVLDWLVVDEAGQMSLADVLAASHSARNILLLGDPQQLAKPSKAAHPAGVGVSALEHFMAGDRTMDVARGLFQEATWRMHADVAGFISEIAYDGRLSAHPSCADRRVLPLDGEDAQDDGDCFAGTGLRHVPVVHHGNTQGSDEECDAVVSVVLELLRRQWTVSGTVKDIGPSDVLVVSPYNVQVRRLEGALEAAGLAGVQVGTVDRFQGREAVAVVYSTASSDAESAPRGLDFLYDVHRLNVAISRAKCLAFWVGSPALLSPRVSAAHQVPLVDAHCRFVEQAQIVDPAPLAAPALA